MSKTYKTISRPAINETVVDKKFCDICNNEITRGSMYEVNDVTVEHRTGFCYPEGGHGEELSADICGDCFDNKIIPFLRSFGCGIYVKDWDY